MHDNEISLLYRYDPRYIPPAKPGCRFIGNSSKGTAQEAIDSYHELEPDWDLVAEPFTPEGDGEGRIKFAVYRKVQE